MPYKDAVKKAAYMKWYNKTKRAGYKWKGKDVWAKARRDELRDKVLAHFGNICNRCGFSDKRTLQIDHVHGGGTQHIKKVSSHVIRYNEALTDTTGKYQLLCANCNWIKKYENDENVRGPVGSKKVG